MCVQRQLYVLVCLGSGSIEAVPVPAVCAVFKSGFQKNFKKKADKFERENLSKRNSLRNKIF
jgi:hypothetical protein